jgi:hypothetical protein
MIQNVLLLAILVKCHCLIALYFLPDHPWLQNIKKAPNVNLGETVKARLQQFSVMNKFKKHALRVNLNLTLPHIILFFNFSLALNFHTCLATGHSGPSFSRRGC